MPADDADLREMETRVQVVLADCGWILERIGRALEERLPYVAVGDRISSAAAVNYYVNYSAWRNPGPTRDVAFFTHIEEAAPEAAQHFFEVAHAVEYCVCMSQLYVDRLRAKGIERVRLIRPGVDLERFRPRLRLGVAGRTYPTARKGEDLLGSVAELEFVELHTTGGNWAVESVPHEDREGFYASIDYLLVPSRYEGGPMPVLEALATGTPVISSEVGFVRELPHISFRTGDALDLRRVLCELYADRLRLRESVLDSTWDRFGELHDRLFHEMGVAPQPSAAARNEPLRVLLVSREDPHGGGPSYRVPRTAEALRARGHQVELTTAAEPDATGFDIAHVFNIWPPEQAVRQLESLGRQGVPLLFSPIFMDLLEHLAAGATLLPLFAAGLTPSERVAVLRSFPAELAGWLEEARKRRPHPLEAYGALLRRCLTHVDAIVVLGDTELAAIREHAPDPPRTFSVPNAPVVVSDRVGDPPEGLASGGYVICAGRLERRKNQLLLIEALRDTGIPLVLVGATPEPDYAQFCREVAAGLPVRFLPHLAADSGAYTALLAHAAVFVLPSWIEGAPLAALDAASLGVRLVLADRGCVREYFEGHARYFNPASVAEIRARVLEAWNEAQHTCSGDPELHGLVADRFSWNRVVEATESAYRSLLGPPVRHPRGAESPPPARRRLEIGSGEDPQPGYEHLDARPHLPDLDHLCDAGGPLPIEDGTFIEVLSRSCLEHIPWRRAPEVLREWVRVLAPGGTLRLYLPDLEYIAGQYLSGRDDEHLHPSYRRAADELLGGYNHRTWALIKLFAGQEYPENFHCAAYDLESLSALMRKVGLIDVRRLEPHYALHVVATKPAS